MARQCIGIDIGSSSIKLVQVRIGRRDIALQNFGIEAVPQHAIVDGVVMNHGAVVEAVRSLTRRIGLRGRQMAIAVSGNSVILKRLSIPVMTGAALEEQMEWEVRQNIPFPREEVTVDHEVLVEKTPQGQMEVLLVAAKRDVIQQYMQVVRDAGLQAVVVDAAALALQNAVEGGLGFTAGDAVAMVNIGASYSTICVVQDGKPVFNRDVRIGGNTYTEAIQQRLAVPTDGAEAYKVGGAIASMGYAADVVPQEVYTILAQVSEQVAAEFQRSFDFFLNDAVDVQISRLYLAGGSALVPQLPKAIQDRSGIPVQLLNPFDHVTIDRRKFDLDYLRANAPIASIAFGLAMRQPGDSR